MDDSLRRTVHKAVFTLMEKILRQEHYLNSQMRGLSELDAD